MNVIKTFRIVALAEATSFLLLLVASVVKRAADEPIGVEILGPIHGALFVAYLVLALLVKVHRGWSIPTTLVVMAGSVVPLGGYVVDWWLVNRDDKTSTNVNGRL